MTEFYEIRVGSESVGSIWKETYGWAAESAKTGMSWDMIDTKDEAVDLLMDNA